MIHLGTGGCRSRKSTTPHAWVGFHPVHPASPSRRGRPGAVRAPGRAAGFTGGLGATGAGATGAGATGTGAGTTGSGSGSANSSDSVNSSGAGSTTTGAGVRLGLRGRASRRSAGSLGAPPSSGTGVGSTVPTTRAGGSGATRVSSAALSGRERANEPSSVTRQAPATTRTRVLINPRGTSRPAWCPEARSRRCASTACAAIGS